MKFKGYSHGKHSSYGNHHKSYGSDHGGHHDSHGEGASLINVSLLNGIGNGNSIGNGNDVSIPVLNDIKVGVGDILSDNLNIYDSNVANVLFDDVIGKVGLGLDALATVHNVLDGPVLFDLPDLFDHI